MGSSEIKKKTKRNHSEPARHSTLQHQGRRTSPVFAGWCPFASSVAFVAIDRADLKEEPQGARALIRDAGNASKRCTNSDVAEPRCGGHVIPTNNCFPENETAQESWWATESRWLSLFFGLGAAKGKSWDGVDKKDLGKHSTFLVI